jgi:hypothetical protein
MVDAGANVFDANVVVATLTTDSDTALDGTDCVAAETAQHQAKWMPRDGLCSVSGRSSLPACADEFDTQNRRAVDRDVKCVAGLVRVGGNESTG